MGSERPNILLFVTDDHAQWASSVYGAKHLPTPNLQYLADQGVRFTSAFTPSPVCSPARACLFTGRLPSQHGIHDWLEELPDGPRHPALTKQLTLPEILQSRGYHTGLCGKWHCGLGRAPAPGFDRWFSYWDDQFPHRGRQRFNDQGSVREHEGYQTPLITERAIDFIRNRPADRPFFLTVGYVDTHSPWKDHPPRLVRNSQNAYLDIPDETFTACHGEPFLRIPEDANEHRQRQIQHAAGVRMIDEQVGRVIDELDAQNLLSNTLIVYTSDHGLMCGHHGAYGKGNGTTPQNFFDESILVPLILSCPGKLPAGEDRDEMVDHCDLFATLLQFADIRPDQAQVESLRFPGRSFLPLLRQDCAVEWREAQCCEYGNARMIRTRQHKYIARNQSYGRRHPDELYDLQLDPRETKNVVDEPLYREIASELLQTLQRYFGYYSDPARDGWDIESQPVCNNDAPWLRGLLPSTNKPKAAHIQ